MTNFDSFCFKRWQKNQIKFHYSPVLAKYKICLEENSKFSLYFSLNYFHFCRKLILESEN